MTRGREIDRRFTAFEQESDLSRDPGGDPKCEGGERPEEARIWKALASVIDPEIGLDVVTLGMVYEVVLDEDEPGRVRITHTLTTPGCPMESHIRNGIQRAVEGVPGVTAAESNLVWEPRWHPGMIRDDAW